MGNSVRYIEQYHSKGETHYRLSQVEADGFLNQMVPSIGDIYTLNKLACSVENYYQGASKEEIDSYIDQLVHANLLVPLLHLPLTTNSQSLSFLAALKDADIKSEYDTLRKIHQKVKQLDFSLSNSLEMYQEIEQLVDEQKIEYSKNHLIQVDSYNEGENLRLEKKLCHQALKGVLQLEKLLLDQENPLGTLVIDFYTKYEGKMIPLTKFLDDDFGVGMTKDKGFSAPLLRGVDIRKKTSTAPGQPFRPIDHIIINLLTNPQNVISDELKIPDKLVNQYKSSGKSKLPHSFSILSSVYRAEQSCSAECSSVIYLRGCLGPSSANLLGRFCHLSSELKEKLTELLDEEQRSYGDVILAEIVHLPEGRVGNVIARPRLREYEIPLMADSSCAPEFQIQLKDLYVYAEDGKIKLWSKKHSKEIMPRLSSAHNYSNRSLGIYRFLCLVQNQMVSVPNFKWHQYFSDAEYLPRLKIGNVIISKRRWRLKRSKVESLSKLTEAEFSEAAKQYLREKRMPEWVNFIEGDNVLTINFSNLIMLKTLLSETQHYKFIYLYEDLDSEFSSIVSKNGLPLCSEVILPFYQANKNKEEIKESRNRSYKNNQLSLPDTTKFCLGSEWLSVKVYLGPGSVEQLLLKQIVPLFDGFRRRMPGFKFYFLRYADPEWHLRIRIKIVNDEELITIIKSFKSLFKPMLLNGPIKNVVYDTYEQESDRYGGSASIQMAENIFSANSVAVLNMLEIVLNEKNDDLRWRFALLGSYKLLNMFIESEDSQVNYITRLRDGFGAEFGDGGKLRRQLGELYKKHRPIIQQDFIDLSMSHKIMTKSIKRQFDNIEKEVVSYLSLSKKGKLTRGIDDILSAHLHMFNNRMFVSYGREQEFVIYDILRRNLIEKKFRKAAEQSS